MTNDIFASTEFLKTCSDF